MLGCGEWVVQITERGGGQPLYEVPYSSLSVPRVVNTSAQMGLGFPTCGQQSPSSCEICAEVEPFRHEVVYYRDDIEAAVGPVWDLSFDAGGASITSRDLSSWLSRRFIERDLWFSADVADIFAFIVAEGMDADNSPNLEVSTRPTGVQGERRYRGKDFQRASDILSELSSTAVDWTMVGRKMLAGGLEILLPTPTLLLHDEGITRVSVSKEGSAFASDVAVFGAVPKEQTEPPVGRATRGTSVYGLVQESFAELLIEDEASAQANAEGRVERMQPVPMRLSATLSPEFAHSFPELIPGAKVDVRLKDTIGIQEVMRLQSVQASVSVNDSGITEEISVDIVPLGVGE